MPEDRRDDDRIAGVPRDRVRAQTTGPVEDSVAGGVAGRHPGDRIAVDVFLAHRPPLPDGPRSVDLQDVVEVVLSTDSRIAIARGRRSSPVRSDGLPPPACEVLGIGLGQREEGDTPALSGEDRDLGVALGEVPLDGSRVGAAVQVDPDPRRPEHREGCPPPIAHSRNDGHHRRRTPRSGSAARKPVAARSTGDDRWSDTDSPNGALRVSGPGMVADAISRAPPAGTFAVRPIDACAVRLSDPGVCRLPFASPSRLPAHEWWMLVWPPWSVRRRLRNGGPMLPIRRPSDGLSPRPARSRRGHSRCGR